MVKSPVFCLHLWTFSWPKWPCLASMKQEIASQQECPVARKRFLLQRRLTVTTGKIQSSHKSVNIQKFIWWHKGIHRCDKVMYKKTCTWFTNRILYLFPISFFTCIAILPSPPMSLRTTRSTAGKKAWFLSCLAFLHLWHIRLGLHHRWKISVQYTHIPSCTWKNVS